MLIDKTALMSTKLIKRIEKKTSGCKTKDADQMDNLHDDDTSSGKRRTILSSRALVNDTLLQSIVPITFIVLGDSTSQSKKREIDIPKRLGANLKMFYLSMMRMLHSVCFHYFSI